MGLTKQYLRYAPCGAFNLISSGNCNVCFVVYGGQEGRYVAAGGCENVHVWDLRLGVKATSIPVEAHAQATYLAASPDKTHIAVGLSNGRVNIHVLSSGEIKTVFAGHKTAISHLAFDEGGHRLASGSLDTEIVTWDMVSESGLNRLSGHKGVVTSVCFFRGKNLLVSSSKDTFIKFWDLDTAHCFHTIAAHVTEVWGLALIGDDEFLVAGSNDSELMVWSIKESNAESSANGEITVEKAGSILREGRTRLVSLTVDNSHRVLSCHGKESRVEVFHFLQKNEVAARAKKRQAKERKKAAKLGVEAPSGKSDVTLKDHIKKIGNFKTSDNVKSLTTVIGRNELRVCVSLRNNSLELYSVQLDQATRVTEANCIRKVAQPGHQGEVRSVVFSSDLLAIASVGANSVKIWNRVSLQCLRTIETDYALSVCFVPGDRHAVVGLKNGHILVVDLSSGEIVEDVPAHTSEVWSIIKTPDQTGVISGSGDTTVKIWQFELVKQGNSKVLSIVHTRTLKLDEPVLSVRPSPCGKLLAASLLDSTVKIFFMDTFKFFLSLYGHALPVLCSDISSDSALIATGSADRKIKIWGLDFGDCHKSLIAHEESVTAVEFVPKTHYLFSCGKDGQIKQWDCDSYDRIITLDGHFGECWNLSVGGTFLVSCGKDRVIRLYEKTDEILVLSDEQEEEREREELATGQDSIVPLPSLKTVSAEQGADNIIECIEILTAYKAQVLNSVKPEVPPIMVALNVKTPREYLAKTLSNIRPSELGESLLLLPFHCVKFLLEMLPNLLQIPNTCEIACKALLLLLQVHHRPIVSDSSQVLVMDKLRTTAFESLRRFRDLVGVNLHGLLFIQRDLEDKEGVTLFRDATLAHRQKQDRKRKKEKAVKAAAVMTL